MMQKIKALFHAEWFLYLLVGGSNTAVCWVLSFLLPRFAHTGYWTTSLITFLFGAAYTYVLNRRFTFRSGDVPHQKTLPRFVLNVAVCYTLAYGLVKPLTDRAVSLAAHFAPETWTTLSLLFANVVYIALNFAGQKFFAFSHGKKEKGRRAD